MRLDYRPFGAALLSLLAIPPILGAEPTDEARASAQGAQRVPAEELRTLYFGHTVVGVKPSGYRYDIPVLADGSIPESPRRGTGKVTIEGDGRACMGFSKLFGGKPRCWTHYRTADGRIVDFNDDGSMGSEKRFEPLP